MKTIAAIATPPGRGAIGVVRMSGPEALKILEKVWKSTPHPVEKFVTHRLYLGNIVKLSTGIVIDKVLAALMRAPNSYTGEDVVEISCHGGGVVIKSILSELFNAGAIPAEPGEFTKRAFLNGKLDLIQAEAVAGLIDAKSKTAAKIAEEQLEGKISKEINDVVMRLKSLSAFVEATIDFPEEDTEFIKVGEIEEKTKEIRRRLASLVKSYGKGKIFKEGVKAVIAGPPNAGKSSLLNALLGSERAIVHHVPGTTRDTIEEESLINDIPFRFVDTAGIRQAEEEVEEMGVDRSKKELSQAEVVLLVVDGSDFKGIDSRFRGELEKVEHVIVVVNKSDLGVKIGKKETDSILNKRRSVRISAKEGKGLDELREILVSEMAGEGELAEDETMAITSERHHIQIKEALAGLEEAEKEIKKKESAEFISLYLRKSLEALGRITGEVTTDEILNEIFSKFCIGK